MPKSTIILPPPNRGLKLVGSPAQIGPRYLHRAENIVFTRDSVKRRNGKMNAYQEPVGSGSYEVTMMKRFYNLASTGAISKKFICAFNVSAGLYVADTDWSDDTQSTISAWTLLDYPNATDNTLYNDYSAGPVVVTQGNIKDAVASKSWLYIFPEFASGDDANDILNVPLRTQGDADSVYLHGLVPPASLDVADTDGQSTTPDGVQWTGVEAVASDVSRISRMVKAPDGRYFFAFIDSSNVLKLAERGTDGTWSSETITGSLSVFTTSANRTFDIAVDSNSNPSIVFCEATTQDLEYVWRLPDTTTWTQDTIDNADNYDYVALAFDSKNEPHVGCHNATLEARYFVKADGSWTAAPGEQIASGGDRGEYVSIAIDEDDNTHACYYETTGQDLFYNKRTSGTWGTEETIDSTNRKGEECWIALDSDGVPSVSYIEDQTGAPYDLWYSTRSGGSWSGNNVEVQANVETGGGTTPPPTQIVFDPDDVPIIVFKYTAINNFGMAIKESGSWTVGEIEQQYSNANYLSIVVDDKTTYRAAIIEPSPSTAERAIFLTGNVSTYYYKLTAEYDEGILGESGPSAETKVIINADIGKGTVANTIDLTPVDTRYDMTKDVTRIYVYRTVRFAKSDGTYYRVGSVTCTAGVPDSDLTDKVTDTDLVANTVLDEDKYLPPKYRTAVIWKDRLVIGHLKGRDTSDSTELDVGDDTSSSIHKNRIRFSRAFQPDVFRLNFFQDILPDGDSGSIQSLIVNPRIDALFVFMENDVVALTDRLGDPSKALSFRPRNIANSHGTPARFSVVEHEGMLFYWTKWGIEVISGFTGRNITNDTIAPLWNMLDAQHPRYADRINMDNIDQVRGVVHKDGQGERILWTYPAATSTENNRILVMDYARWRDQGFQDDGVFSVYTGWTINCFESWDGEGDRGELFGGESDLSDRGWIYRLELGNEDQHGEAGITANVQIPVFYIYPGLSHAGRPDLYKRWASASIEARAKSVASTGTLSVDLISDIDDSELSETMETISWSKGGIRREAYNFSRASIGAYAGVRIEGTDGALGVAGGSYPFELLALSLSYSPIKTRSRQYVAG